MKEQYTSPSLSRFGSIASLTLQKTGSDVDGLSNNVGNMSMSDETGGGSNDGMSMPMMSM